MTASSLGVGIKISVSTRCLNEILYHTTGMDKFRTGSADSVQAEVMEQVDIPRTEREIPSQENGSVGQRPWAKLMGLKQW